MISGRIIESCQMGKSLEGGIDIWAEGKSTDYYNRLLTSAKPSMKLFTSSLPLYPIDPPKSLPKILYIDHPSILLNYS